MNTEDFQKFHDGMVGVMSFYGKDISGFALDVWWSALRNYDLPAVTQAFNRWLSNPDHGQFPPKPADVIKMLSGSTQDKAFAAWAKVDRAVRSVGAYASVAFDDPIIHRVIHDMGGWIGLGQKSEDEWPFVARNFENMYRGYAARGEVPDYPQVLLGIAEAYNGSKGFKSDPPRLVGNRERAMMVIEGGRDAATLIGFSSAPASMRLIGGVDAA